MSQLQNKRKEVSSLEVKDKIPFCFSKINDSFIFLVQILLKNKTNHRAFLFTIQ